MTSYMGRQDGADKRREVEREQWADLSRVEFEFNINGMGEGISEPIYFGRAYDSPPRFSYSLIGGDSEQFEEVRAITWPTEGLGGPARSNSEPWSLEVALMANTHSVGTQDTNAAGVTASLNGDKLFVVGNTGRDINEYSMTDFRMLDIAFTQSFSVSGQTSSPLDVKFKPDGTKMYVLGGTRVYQYTLPTPWSLTGASYDSVLFDFSAQDSSIFGFDISPDGTRLLCVGSQNDRLLSYSFATAWLISSLQYDSFYQLEATPYTYYGPAVAGDGLSLAVTRIDTAVSGPAFDSRSRVFQYYLGTAWDVSSVSTSELRFVSPSSQGWFLSYNPDGTYLYQMGNDTVYAFSLSSGVSMRADRLRWDGWVEDPQFERQMQWSDPYIPDFNDFGTYEYGQKIFEDVAGKTIYDSPQYSSFRSLPGMVNTWFQGFPLEDVCVEPRILGADVLRDPGFEVMLDGFEIPNYVAGLTYEPDIHDSLGNFAYTDQLGWAADSASSSFPFGVSSASPRTGIKHIRTGQKVDIGSGPHRLYVVTGVVCANPRFVYGARVEPGDVATLSGYAKTDDPFDGVTIRIHFEWYDSSFSFIDSDFSSFMTVQTTYTQHSFSGDFYPVAPASAYYLHAYFAFGMGGAQSSSVADLDDTELVVM